MAEQQPMAAQSTRPEDTRLAREEHLDAEDFRDPLEEMKCLTLDLIKDADDATLEPVPCPEWGGKVFVRNPTGEERNAFEQEGMVRRGRNREVNLRDLKERLVIWFACDAERRPLFDRDKLKEQLPWLRKKNAAPINRIADTALRLGGWTDQDVEDMVGNSESGPNSNGISD
jgi:hypothetical protein